jgi:peptidoglycan hydrolase CwlO-like protein
MKAGTMVESTSQIRALSEKSQNADKKVQVFKNQLSRLEAEMAEREAQHGQAEEKWAVRVKEYENQLKAMAEKIKTEKQGGKERAAELLRQIG